MKKMITVVALLMLVILTSACSKPLEGVSDTLVEREITGADAFRNQSGDYEYEISHSVDQESGIDNVTVLVEFPNNYGAWTYYGYGAYQYNKSADIWEIYDEFQWESLGSIFSEECFIGYLEKEFEIDNVEGTFSFEIEDIDFDRNEITGSVHLYATEYDYSDGHNEVEMHYNGIIPFYGDEDVGYTFQIFDENCSAGFELSLTKGVIIRGIFC